MTGTARTDQGEGRRGLAKSLWQEPPPKDGSTLAGGSVSSASPSRVKAIDFQARAVGPRPSVAQEEIASLREEVGRGRIGLQSTDRTPKAVASDL